MSELQEARAGLIAALEESQRLSAENERLRRENQALQERLIFAEFRATMMKSLYDGLWQGLFVTRS